MGSKKATTKIDVSAVAKEAAGMMDTISTFDVIKLAGVAKSVKTKHSELGSGFVFVGNFAGWQKFGESNKIESDSLTLPSELGSRIAKAVKKAGKNAVKFSVSISAKKSEQLAQGYIWVSEWQVEPVELGQMDIVKDMLGKLIAEDS